MAVLGFVAMTDLREIPLPSERQRPGDPRVVGFQTEPSQEHVEQSAAAATELGALVTMAQPANARPLRVRFCHVRLPPRLPFNLYGFNIINISDDGELIDYFDTDEEILYALIVNQPVELQREASIVFLNDLIGRQGPIADVVAERRSLGELPDLAAAADTSSSEISMDTLRFSLEHAAEALKTRAAAAGYRLEIKYRLDPLPRREDVARRVPQLRHLYNTQKDIRQGVDRTVATIGGRPPELRGGDESLRGWVQQQTSLMGIRQFMNQCMRDADVCGNGYVDFGFLGLDPTLRCLKPQDVEVLPGDRYRLLSDPESRPLDRVMHHRGLEQFDCPYGISPWEVVLYVNQRQSILDGVGKLARAALTNKSLTAEQQQRLEDTVRVAEAIERDTKNRLDRLLWFPRSRLRPVEGDLYFVGQEDMET